MKKIEIEIPDGKVAKWVDGVLTLVDDKPKDITERIKTFEDACEELGDEHPLVKEYWGVVNINLDITQDLISYLKLRIIITTLNEGWKPIFDDHECRYYPWYYMFSKTVYKELYGNEEEECGIVCRSKNNADASCGLVYVYANCSSLDSDAGIGSHLFLKTKELAEYCGKQFIDIWKDFLLG